MDNLGFEVMHVYGLTETYGHILQCAWNEECNHNQNLKADIKARQGVRYPNNEEVVLQIQRPMKKFQWMEKQWEKF